MIGLLSALPLHYRLIAIALAFIASFTTGFVKGKNYEHKKIMGEQAELLAKQINDATILNKQISDQLFDSQAKAKALEEKNKQIDKRLRDAIGKSPSYTSKQCEITDEVRDTLNEKIKNSWRSK